MALTVSVDNPNIITGAEHITVTTVTFDASYVTGGMPLTAAQLGLNAVQRTVSVLKSAGATSGSVAFVWYDQVNSKLKAFTATGEVANTTSLLTVVAQVTAYGY